jgi:hypothetical protein
MNEEEERYTKFRKEKTNAWHGFHDVFLNSFDSKNKKDFCHFSNIYQKMLRFSEENHGAYYLEEEFIESFDFPPNINEFAYNNRVVKMKEIIKLVLKSEGIDPTIYNTFEDEESFIDYVYSYRDINDCNNSSDIANVLSSHYDPTYCLTTKNKIVLPILTKPFMNVRKWGEQILRDK